MGFLFDLAILTWLGDRAEKKTGLTISQLRNKGLKWILYTIIAIPIAIITIQYNASAVVTVIIGGIMMKVIIKSGEKEMKRNGRYWG